MQVLKCAMHKECQDKVTHIDNKGFIYCLKHGQRRQMYCPCRKLKPIEVKTLESDKPLARY